MQLSSACKAETYTTPSPIYWYVVFLFSGLIHGAVCLGRAGPGRAETFENVMGRAEPGRDF